MGGENVDDVAPDVVGFFSSVLDDLEEFFVWIFNHQKWKDESIEL